jgi:hypothetical protein
VLLGLWISTTASQRQQNAERLQAHFATCNISLLAGFWGLLPDPTPPSDAWSVVVLDHADYRQSACFLTINSHKHIHLK